MSSTNKTEHYNLPQFVTSDKPSWLTDENAAMQAIDAAMFANSQAVAQAATLAGTAKTAADNALSVADGAVTAATDAMDAVDNIVLQHLAIAPASRIDSYLLATRLKIGTKQAVSVERLGVNASQEVGVNTWLLESYPSNPFELPTVTPVAGQPISAWRLGVHIVGSGSFQLVAYYDGSFMRLFAYGTAFGQTTPEYFLNSPLTAITGTTITLTNLPE